MRPAVSSPWVSVVTCSFTITPLPGSGLRAPVIPVVLPVITAVVLPVVDYRASHSAPYNKHGTRGFVPGITYAIFYDVTEKALYDTHLCTRDVIITT